MAPVGREAHGERAEFGPGVKIGGKGRTGRDDGAIAGGGENRQLLLEAQFGLGQQQHFAARLGAIEVFLADRTGEQHGPGIEARDRRGGTSVDEAAQIKRPARLGAGAREAVAAEGLDADDGADGVAVDVDIAGADPVGDESNGFVKAGMEAEGQAIAEGIDAIDEADEIAAGIAHDMQHRAEDFAGQLLDARRAR